MKDKMTPGLWPVLVAGQIMCVGWVEELAKYTKRSDFKWCRWTVSGRERATFNSSPNKSVATAVM